MQQNMENNSEMCISLELLVCPECKGALEAVEIEAQSYLGCAACKLAYPLKEGIPVMLQDEAVAF